MIPCAHTNSEDKAMFKKASLSLCLILLFALLLTGCSRGSAPAKEEPAAATPVVDTDANVLQIG